MTNASDVVIWSADVTESVLDKVLADDLPLKYVKLDRGGLTRMGLAKIAAVQDLGYKVFADAKIGEIPSKATSGTEELPGLAAEHLLYKPWMLNCLPDIRSTGFMQHEDPERVDGFKRFADLCHAAGTRPCGVTVLTSMSEAQVWSVYRNTRIEQVLVFVEMYWEAGFTDIVCSPLEAEAIRADSRFDGLELNTPAIRLPGSGADDQAAVDTPVAAIAAGATRLVIGRDLTREGDFRANFQRVADNLNSKE